MTTQENNNKRKEIPAILLLAGQKTYGRTSGKVPIYKCVPNDPELAPLLVPYKMKTMGFTKVFSNLYVLVTQKEENNEKEGTLANVIGPVDDVQAFYEYQIICKNLNISLTHLTKTLIRQKITPDLQITDAWLAKYHIQDLTKINTNIYTIDPDNCKDFDDAFSIRQGTSQGTSQGTDGKNCILTIYIANVPVILDTLDLWDKLSERVATIYLPNAKRPMLPPILSEGLCSLKAGQDRVAFAMEFSLNLKGIMTYKTHYNCLVNVRRNFVYEERALLQNKDYQLLKRMFICEIDSHRVDCHLDSHEVVASMMIGMNAQSATLLIQKQCGIFRTVTKKENSSYDTINSQTEDDAIKKHIYNWKCMHGQYVLFKDNTFYHATLDLDAYAHVTSPIRRLVDVINMSWLICDDLTASFSFITEPWMEQLNKQMKAIQRVQNTCALLDKITNTPFIADQEFDGYVFDENMVHIPSLHLTTKFTAQKEGQPIVSALLPSKSKFKLFLFSDEHALYKKVRIMQIGCE